MTTESSPRLGLDYVMAAQAQKHVTVNETFRRLDALVQASANSRSVDIEPVSPSEGDAYILGENLVGNNWALMQPNSLAVFRDSEWAEIMPSTGWRVWLEDSEELLVFDGSDWKSYTALISVIQQLARLGVGTQADEANPFAAKLNTALWTALGVAEGGTGDLRCTLNKESGANILSLLFQSDYEGRAEIGLIGDNNLLLKLSSDGVSWVDVLRASPDRVDVGATEGLWLERLNGDALSARRNLLINGDFSIGQRGQQFLSPVAGEYFLDRWKFVSDGGMSCEFSRENFSTGQTDISGNPRHFLEWRLTGLATGNPWIEQRIEGVDRLAEGPATLSLFANATRSVSMVVRVRRHFGSGGSPTDVVFQQTLSLSTGWQRYSVAAAIPALSGKTLGQGHRISVEFYLLGGETDVDIRLADIQLEAGNLATQFERRSMSENLRLCQRYFVKTCPVDDLVAGAGIAGRLTTSTSGPAQSAVFDWRLPVEMCATPAIEVYSPASGASGMVDASGTDIAASVISASVNGVAIQSAAHGTLTLAHVHITADAEL
ncbi:DUF2793 domain-containing protein [Hyphobacterium sp. HN65]|uniref:DUF2793 domain-containing protein n=1 Tax=Hyphobacterium lacteum TaxID=3116575 RepID=A0ABU7LTI0_9PROT|nr:DUF2793 domain-containing protein [Hyphobacterium sp. HN65]MEE2527222.1 DUF2793 domain-containing protein [Hyphobacterium sp. HN65]